MTALITIAAQYLLLAAGLLALLHWLRLPRRAKAEEFVLAIVTGVLALSLAKVGAAVFDDPRPFVTDQVTPLFSHPADNGFPSDHTLLAAVAGTVVLRTSRPWGLSLLGLAVVIGAARVLAHIHHPIDIAGSLAFAVVAALIAYPVAPLVLSWIPMGRPESTRV